MKWIPHGFKLAAAINIFGILLFSKGLTNTYLAELDPQVFSTFGQGCIILWGLAYLAVAERYREVRWLVAVFTVEKLVYTGAFAMPMRAPRRWFYPAGYCALGNALPNAIGACLARPGTPVAVLAE